MVTPFHFVSSLVHLVTQLISTVTVSVGSCWNADQLHETGDLTRPSIRNDHRSSSVCGVGPAESTGKSVTRYCPGGKRFSTSGGRRRPRNPREINPAIAVPPFHHYDRLGSDAVPRNLGRYNSRNMQERWAGSTEMTGAVEAAAQRLHGIVASTPL